MQPATFERDHGRDIPRAALHPVGHAAILGAFPLAALLAVASFAGLQSHAIYARETLNWRAQALGQDWVDLLLAVPWLVASAVAALRGSRTGVLLLAGGLAYSAYELMIYAFAVHYNALFLVYCAGLGISVWSFFGSVCSLPGAGARSWFTPPLPRRTAGSVLIAVGVLFALLWLAEILPALVRGTLPKSVEEAGVFTNPVQVIDLSVVLPAHIVAGVLLLRRHPLGAAAASVVLAFGVLMAASIAGMVVYMHASGVEPSLGVAWVMMGLSLGTGAVLVGLLRRLR